MLLKLWPRSLLWRSFFLIATLMLAAVVAWLGMFREAELEPRARMLAQTIASVTNLTRAALLTARPESRLDLLAELSDTEGVHVYPADADDRIEPPPPNTLTRHLERELLERLGAETRLAFVLNNEPGLFVSFRIFSGDEGEYWLAMPRERIERRLPLRWFGWGAGVLLLALSGAWLIAYRIVRPLEEERALLLAGISHDLRTPLTRLRMEVEMSVADATARAEMAADIAEMDGTIGQFLDFARPQGLIGRAGEETDLAAMLADIAQRYGEKVQCRPANAVTIAPPRSHIQLAAPHQGGVGLGRPGADFVLSIHPESLRRAIVNLIENALRHAGTEHPVELELTRAGGKIVVAVLDRGPGIAPADAERLMQPFTRGEAARTGAGGAGLGLAIVDRIARADGGRLELHARPGGGLAAQLVLPAS